MGPPECTRLRHADVPLKRCPACGAEPFDPFLRGLVQSGIRKWFKTDYCCLICRHCKTIVDYEAPDLLVA